MVSIPMSVTVTLTIALSSLTILVVADSWGASFSLGPTKSYIIESITTIDPATPPQPQLDDLALWPGISNGSGDLIQTVILSDASNAWCGGDSKSWCVQASLFGKKGQISGKGAKLDANEEATIHYKRNGDKWTQTVTRTKTGAVISTLDSDSGAHVAKGWGTATECNVKCQGTQSTHYYYNTTITLEEADPSFGNTKATQQGATYEGFESTEGGKVWKIAKITIPPMRKP